MTEYGYWGTGGLSKSIFFGGGGPSFFSLTIHIVWTSSYSGSLRWAMCCFGGGGFAKRKFFGGGGVAVSILCHCTTSWRNITKWGLPAVVDLGIRIWRRWNYTGCKNCDVDRLFMSTRLTAVINYLSIIDTYYLSIINIYYLPVINMYYLSIINIHVNT